MAESPTLFIVISAEFRNTYLRGKGDEPVHLAGVTLVALAEPLGNLPDPWGEEVEELVVGEIENQAGPPDRRVRMAGHIGPCFGSAARTVPAGVPRDEGLRDRRFRDKEDLLRNKLGANLDVQVWGFHHEKDYSSIWKALLAAGPLIRDGAPEEPMREAAGRLAAAFDEAEAGEQTAEKQDEEVGSYERARRIRHDILGLFSPLRLDLSTAADREAVAACAQSLEGREQALSKAKRLREGVAKALPGNLVEGRGKLKQLAALVPDGEKNPRWLEAAERLKQTPPAARFEEFWQWNDDLEKTLAELVRWPHE